MTCSCSVRDVEAVRSELDARAAGRARGDEVCRVEGWSSDQTLAVLRDQRLLAQERVRVARAELAYAEGLLDTLCWRVEGTSEDRRRRDDEETK